MQAFKGNCGETRWRWRRSQACNFVTSGDACAKDASCVCSSRRQCKKMRELAPSKQGFKSVASGEAR